MVNGLYPVFVVAYALGANLDGRSEFRTAAPALRFDCARAGTPPTAAAPARNLRLLMEPHPIKSGVRSPIRRHTNEPESFSECIPGISGDGNDDTGGARRRASCGTAEDHGN